MRPWGPAWPSLAQSVAAGHPVALSLVAPGSCSLARVAGEVRGTELVSAAAGMMWSIQQPLPCSCACPVCPAGAAGGWQGQGEPWTPQLIPHALGCPPQAPARASVMVTVTWGSSQVPPRNLLYPGWHRLGQAGMGRDFRGFWHWLLAQPGEEGRAVVAIGLDIWCLQDFPGSLRE